MRINYVAIYITRCAVPHLPIASPERRLENVGEGWRRLEKVLGEKVIDG